MKCTSLVDKQTNNRGQNFQMGIKKFHAIDIKLL